MLKLENIVVRNGTTHCKLKQGGKKNFNSNILEFTKISCTFMGNHKELHLLNSRRKIPLNISLLILYINLIMQGVAWQRRILLNPHSNFFFAVVV
jgi:hypothetical protein